MKLPLSISALVLLVPLALVPLGCDSGDEGDDEAAEADADSTDGMDTTGDETTDTGEPDPAAGQAIHDASCAIASCHSAADMVQLSERVPTLTDDEIMNQVRNGGMGPEGTMPPFNENQIDAQGLLDLVAFLRQMYP